MDGDLEGLCPDIDLEPSGPCGFGGTCYNFTCICESGWVHNAVAKSDGMTYQVCSIKARAMYILWFVVMVCSLLSLVLTCYVFVMRYFPAIVDKKRVLKWRLAKDLIHVCIGVVLGVCQVNEGSDHFLFESNKWFAVGVMVYIGLELTDLTSHARKYVKILGLMTQENARVASTRFSDASSNGLFRILSPVMEKQVWVYSKLFIQIGIGIWYTSVDSLFSLHIMFFIEISVSILGVTEIHYIEYPLLVFFQDAIALNATSGHMTGARTDKKEKRILKAYKRLRNFYLISVGFQLPMIVAGIVMASFPGLTIMFNLGALQTMALFTFGRLLINISKSYVCTLRFLKWRTKHRTPRRGATSRVSTVRSCVNNESALSSNASTLTDFDFKGLNKSPISKNPSSVRTKSDVMPGRVVLGTKSSAKLVPRELRDKDDASATCQ